MNTQLQVAEYQNEEFNNIIQFPTKYNGFTDLGTEEKTDVIDVKYKKDGTPKKTKSNKVKGEKSEVYPFQIGDMKKMHDYFLKKGMWQYYLIFVFSCNMARRISDTLLLTWKDFYDPISGEMREDLSIKEKKTNKLANPHINSACRNAINLYLEKTNTDPTENDYKNKVFIQTQGNYKGNVITAVAYHKALKKAASEIGIKYNVGTHSARKTFGMITRMIHPNDYDSMELLQNILNHSDVKTTQHYIGLTKQKVDAYFNDVGEFYNDYIVGDKTFVEEKQSPIISIDTNILRDIINTSYNLGIKNANSDDIKIHIDAVNSIMALIDKNIK